MTEPLIETKEEIMTYLDNLLRDMRGANAVIESEKINHYFKWLREELAEVIRMVNEL